MMPILHRINDIDFNEGDLIIEPSNDVDYVCPATSDVEHIQGVSHFIPYCEYYKSFHESFGRRYKLYGCKQIAGNCVPEGIAVKVDLEIRRRGNKEGRDMCGRHVTIYPTLRMPLSEFRAKLKSIYADAKCDESDGSCLCDNVGVTTFDKHCAIGGNDNDSTLPDQSDNKINPSERDDPSQSMTMNMHRGSNRTQPSHQRVWQIRQCDDLPDDRLLRQASTVLFDMARDMATPPNRALRCLYFHYLLSEDDACCDWLFSGDALSQHVAWALEFADDAPNFDVEETRDFMRLKLHNVLPNYDPEYRADGLEDEEKYDTIVLFGDNIRSTNMKINSENPTVHYFEVNLATLVSQLKSIIDNGLLESFIVQAREGDKNRGFDAILSSLQSPDSSDPDPSQQRFLRLLEEIVICAPTSIACEAASLAATIPHIPAMLAKMFRNTIDANPMLANGFLSALLCADERSGLADTLLRVVTQSSYLYRLRLSSDSVKQAICVTVFETDTLSTTQSKVYATVIGKCLTTLRDEAWGLHGRILVMCANHDLDIALSLLCPDDVNRPDDIMWAWRSALVDKLLAIPYVRQQLEYSGCNDSLKMRTEANVHQLFFLVSFSEHMHPLAILEMEKCFKRMALKFNEFAGVMVEACDVNRAIRK